MKNTFNIIKEKAKNLRNKADTKLIRLLVMLVDYNVTFRLFSINKQKRTTGFICTYAYKRAKGLSGYEHKRNLLSILDENQTAPAKRLTYYALAHVCSNSNDTDLFNFLMSRLESERDKHIRISILKGIRGLKKSKELNLEPIIKLTHSANNILRNKAILALQNADSSEVELLLINLFKKTKERSTKKLITDTLKTMGTEKSIPVLERVFNKTRDDSLRRKLQFTIDQIRERTATNLVGNLQKQNI